MPKKHKGGLKGGENMKKILLAVVILAAVLIGGATFPSDHTEAKPPIGG